jgi:hypothetical protein
MIPGMRTMASLPIVLMLACAASPLAASPSIDGIVTAGEYAQSASFRDGAVTVSWSIEGSSASFAVSARTAGWVALGFGALQMMEGADMAIGSAPAGGEGRVVDSFSTGPTGPHPADTLQNGRQSLEAAVVRETNGVTVMELRRPLAADDAADRPVAAGDRFIWAFGGNDDINSHHAAAGAGVLSSAAGAVRSAGQPAGQSSGRASLIDILLYVLPHALPLVLSFLLMTTGMLIARYGKKNKRWLAIHRPMGIIAGLLGLVGLVLGIRMVALASGTHLRVLHAWVGAATLVAVAAAPLLGQGMFWAKKGKAEIRKAHRWIGRAAILMMALTIVLGLVQAGIIG